MNDQQNIPEEKSSTGNEEVEKSNEEVLANQSVNISEALVPPTINPQPLTMEVHHHTHAAHGKKNWKTYFWEFLMLFLAVFCGFMAEYQLEHTIEHQREKQFMSSMVEDLQKDVVMLENELKVVMVQHTKLDSLTKIIYEGTLEPEHVRKMYELQRRYLYPLTLTLINRTELQLKNSGAMRLIRNRQVADSIISYWSTTELLYETREAFNVHRGKAKDISFSLFNNKYYKHTVDFSLDFPLDSLMGEPKLMSKNPVLFIEFANRVSHMSDLLKFNYKRRVERQTGNARRLIQLIKKEYHLK